MEDTLQGDFHLAAYQLEYSEGLIVNSRQTDSNKLNRHAKPGEVGEEHVISETRTNLECVNNAPTTSANNKKIFKTLQFHTKHTRLFNKDGDICGNTTTKMSGLPFSKQNKKKSDHKLGLEGWRGIKARLRHITSQLAKNTHIEMSDLTCRLPHRTDTKPRPC